MTIGEKPILPSDFNRLAQRVGDVKGTFGSRVITHIQHEFHRVVTLFKTGKWSTDAQVCARLSDSLSKCTKELKNLDKGINPDTPKRDVSNNLEFHLAVRESTKEMKQLADMLAKSPGTAVSKEFKKLVDRFGELKQTLDSGVDRDREILGTVKAKMGEVKRGKGPEIAAKGAEALALIGQTKAARQERAAEEFLARRDKRMEARDKLEEAKKQLEAAPFLQRRAAFEVAKKKIAALPEMHLGKQAARKEKAAALEALLKEPEAREAAAAAKIKAGYSAETSRQNIRENIPIMIKLATRYGIEERLNEPDRKTLSDISKRTDLSKLSDKELIAEANKAREIINKGFGGHLSKDFAEVFLAMKNSVRTLQKQGR